MKVTAIFALLAVLAFPRLSAQEPRQSPSQMKTSNSGHTPPWCFSPRWFRKETARSSYNLGPEQFVVEDNGARQLVSVEEDLDSSGISLVVVVQCSRSAPSEFSKLKGLGTMIDAIVGDTPTKWLLSVTVRRPIFSAIFQTIPTRFVARPHLNCHIDDGTDWPRPIVYAAPVAGCRDSHDGGAHHRAALHL